MYLSLPVHFCPFPALRRTIKELHRLVASRFFTFSGFLLDFASATRAYVFDPRECSTRNPHDVAHDGYSCQRTLADRRLKFPLSGIRRVTPRLPSEAHDCSPGNDRGSIGASRQELEESRGKRSLSPNSWYSCFTFKVDLYRHWCLVVARAAKYRRTRDTAQYYRGTHEERWHPSSFELT